MDKKNEIEKEDAIEIKNTKERKRELFEIEIERDAITFIDDLTVDIDCNYPITVKRKLHLNFVNKGGGE